MAGRSRSSRSATHQELWQMAKYWLASSNVLPPGHKVYEGSPTVFDLAHSLRDGVALCQIANCLRPYSVRDINLKPQMSPFLCLKNIRGFLHACVNNFGLKESVLFDAHELYDVSDFGKVVTTLSHLSKCKDAITAGLIPFPSDRALSLNVPQKDEDIYGNLEEIAMTKDVAEENVYDAVTIEDDTKIYDDVVSIKKRLAIQDNSSKTDEKRVYVIEELLGTEQNYVEALTSIKEKFIDQLGDVLSPEDSKTIFVNIEDLLKMHQQFLGKLDRACRTKKELGNAISSCFVISKDQFLEYGKYCREMQNAQNHVDKLCENDPEVKRRMAECCQNANGGKFGLRSLLVIPMQRVLKYPLLLRELIKHSKSLNTEKASLEKALQAMQDVAHYINAVKRDDESIKTLNQISSSLIKDKDKEDLLPELISFGLLVKDGDIQIKINEERAFKKRYAFLLDRVLLMCKVRGEQYIHKETLHLDHYNVTDSVNSPGKGKFVHGWTMNGNSPEAGKGSFEMFTKTDDMKRKWVEDIQRTISNLTLSDYNLGNHRFELTTFLKPTYCVVCKNLLCGLINQGYSCQGCHHTCHKICIEKSPVCKSSRKVYDSPPSFVSNSRYPSLKKQNSEPTTPSSPPLPPRGRNKSEPAIPLFTSSNVISITRFHGHAPGKKATLVFDAGEEIEVLQRSDPEWWEGKSKRTGKHGFFPRNHVEPIQERRASAQLQRTTTKYIQSKEFPPTPEEVTIIDEDLSMYKWFAGKIDREDAKERLEKTIDGTFLIRESSGNPGQYALSLRHKYNVKHIKIVVSNGMFCITALKLFPSIVAMIDYYRNNTLGVSFPGLDTCLTRGINEARRESKSQGIGFARVKFDYEARDPREISIKKQSRILIFNKDGDWWKGENTEGQVGFFPSNFVKMLDEDGPE